MKGTTITHHKLFAYPPGRGALSTPTPRALFSLYEASSRHIQHLRYRKEESQLPKTFSTIASDVVGALAT